MRYKDVIERSNGKHPSLEKGPMKLVFPTLAQSKRVQEVKEQDKDIHPILSRSDKTYTPQTKITR
jgi:hypothetical protein